MSCIDFWNKHIPAESVWIKLANVITCPTTQQTFYWFATRTQTKATLWKHDVVHSEMPELMGWIFCWSVVVDNIMLHREVNVIFLAVCTLSPESIVKEYLLTKLCQVLKKISSSKKFPIIFMFKRLLSIQKQNQEMFHQQQNKRMSAGETKHE